MHIHTRLTTVALMGFVLIAAAACGGGGGGLSKMEEEALQEQVEAAEEAQRKAEEAAAEEERKRKEAEAAAAEEERKRREAEAEAEAERQKAEEAAKAEQEAEQEAERRIEEAELQADVAVRTPLLITELSADVSGVTGPDDAGIDMGVRYRRGESRMFTRPLNLPAKGSAPSVPGSWSSASFSGPRGNVGTDTVYLYTNIQAPSSKAFWKVHGENVPDLTGAASGFTGTPTVTVSGFGTTAKELYPGSGGTLDGGTTTSDTKARSISGTYDGYSGTFKCATGCEIEAAEGGALTFTGDWTFTASLTAKRASKYAEEDTEFLYFGIWAYEPKATTGTPDFKWAAGGDSGDISGTNFTALEGTATFTGGAIGKYALAKVAGREAQIGTFTATANFTASFAGASSTISGRITDFKEGGSSLGADWQVFLGDTASTAAPLTAAGVVLQADGVNGAIDGDSAEGDWFATLHGSDNADMSSVDDYTAAKYPRADVAGVAGWFNAAAGTNAAIAGSFGAACTTGTMCAR